jgi:hypothetical protein
VDSKFQKSLEYVTGYKANRLQYTILVLDNPELFPELIRLCFLTSYQYAAKACWVLELVCNEKLQWLEDHLDFFSSNIQNLKDESAIRPAAKICLLLALSHFKKKEIQLIENQLQQITETCFDWLTTDVKVASKCYAIRTLHLIGNHYKWIHPELKIILQKDYTTHSAAYKAVGREILKKIK